MPKKELPILGRFMLRLMYLLVLALLGCSAFLFYKIQGYDTSIGDLQKSARESKSERARCERSLEGLKTETRKAEASRKDALVHLHSALGYEPESEKYADLTRLAKHVIDHTSVINEKAVDPPMDPADVTVKTLLVALTAQADRVKKSQVEAWEKAKAQAKEMAEAHAKAEERAQAEAEAKAEAEAAREEALYTLCVTLGYMTDDESAPDLSALSELIKKDLARINGEGDTAPLPPNRLNVKALLSEMTRQLAVKERALAEKTVEIENLQAELDKKK
jgi:hypothetical protein